MPLFGSFCPAEADQRVATGFFRGQATLNIFFRSQIEVNGHFGVLARRA